MKTAAYSLVVLALVACGPMNPRPDAPSTPTKALTVNASSVSAGSNGEFAFSVKPQAQVEPAGKPVLGTNQYVLHLAHASDFSPVSKETKVTLNYTHAHEKIPAPTPFTGAVVPQADGSYLLTVDFAKSGTWNLNIEATEPGSSANAQAEPSVSAETGSSAAAPAASENTASSVTDNCSVSFTL